MTIKQYGGVFGRNPTFNDVTIEGQLTFDGDIDINSDLKVDGDLDVTGGMTVDTDTLVVDDTNNRVGVGTAAPLVSLESKTAGNGLPASSGTAQPNGAIRASSPATSGILDFGINGGAPWIQATDRTDLSQLYTISLNPNGGNVSIGNGNLVIGTSGKGIDFSATAGSGTSELFSDYEEGTWTATLTGATSAPSTAVTTTALYTKIGDVVHLEMAFSNVNTTGASGTLKVTGLPFQAAPTALSTGSPITYNLTVTNKYNVALIGGTGQEIFVYSVASGGAWTTESLPATTGAYFFLSMTYKV